MPFSTDEVADAQKGRWTVKGVPLRTRMRAIACARRAGKPAGEWLEWAIDVAAERQRAGAVLPPVDEPAPEPGDIAVLAAKLDLLLRHLGVRA